MNAILGTADVGRKNIGFALVLFLLLGVVAGIPLTIDMFGGSLLTSQQYQTWKVIHGYSVFLAFINYFLGLAIDRFQMARTQKELISWSFLSAGLVGGVGRTVLVLLSALGQFGRAASLAETMLFVLGTFVLARGQMRSKSADPIQDSAQVKHARAA